MSGLLFLYMVDVAQRQSAGLWHRRSGFRNSSFTQIIHGYGVVGNMSASKSDVAGSNPAIRAMILWRNWLALRTFNAKVRVRVPVGSQKCGLGINGSLPG